MPFLASHLDPHCLLMYLQIHVFHQLAIKEVTYSAEVARICMPINIICTKANYGDPVEMGGMSHRSWDCTVDLNQMLSVI